MNVGRNFDEILRVIDALQGGGRRQDRNDGGLAPGGEVIVPPSIVDDDAAGLFPQGWDEIRPYLRKVRLQG